MLASFPHPLQEGEEAKLLILFVACLGVLQMPMGEALSSSLVRINSPPTFSGVSSVGSPLFCLYLQLSATQMFLNISTENIPGPFFL